MSKPPQCDSTSPHLRLLQSLTMASQRLAETHRDTGRCKKMKRKKLVRMVCTGNRKIFQTFILCYLNVKTKNTKSKPHFRKIKFISDQTNEQTGLNGPKSKVDCCNLYVTLVSKGLPVNFVIATL